MSAKDQDAMWTEPWRCRFKLLWPFGVVAAFVVLAIAILGRRDPSSTTHPTMKEDASASTDETPADKLFSAVYRDDCDGIARLIEAGADVNSVNPANEDGGTPIMLAATFGQVRIVELLLSKGAAVDSRDLQGTTPLHRAMFESSWTEVAGLPKHGSNEDMLRVTEMLLAANASVDAVDNEGATPLHLAAAVDDPARLGALLAGRAQPNVADNEGRTPLMYAVEARNRSDHLLERMRMLIDHGADTELRDSAGKTALQIAQESLARISSPDLSRSLDESNAAFRKLFAPPGLNARAAAELQKSLDDTQKHSHAWIASAKKNLPLAIRLLQEVGGK